MDDEILIPSSALCMVSCTILDLRKATGPSNINIERAAGFYLVSDICIDGIYKILEVAQGVEYLHSQGVIQRDLHGCSLPSHCWTLYQWIIKKIS
jgi:hypothetical protein